MAADRESSRSWWYFGDPRAISTPANWSTGSISTTGDVSVAGYSKEGQLTKRVIFKGLGRDAQQFVARLPPRRARHGLLSPHTPAPTCRRPASPA